MSTPEASSARAAVWALREAGASEVSIWNRTEQRARELAKELGAEVVRLEGTDIPATLARFALEKGITHAIFGRTREPVWRQRLKGSVLDRFMRLAPEVDVVVVGDRHEPEADSEEP